MLLNTPSTEVLYFILLAILVAAVATAYFVRSSKFGLGLLSIKGNEEAADAMGINTTKYKVIAFCISSVFMGFIGTVMALRWTFIEPTLAFNPLITFQVTIMAVLGGMEDLRGPILGAAMLTIISEILGVQFVNYYLMILGITLIVIIKFLPQGVMGAINKRRISKKIVSVRSA
jgi:branched-chain amino acid transport system permease protein